MGENATNNVEHNWDYISITSFYVKKKCLLKQGLSALPYLMHRLDVYNHI